MQTNGNDGADSAPRQANQPPPMGNVHGLGYIDVLRLEVQPAQLPWLVEEIEVRRAGLEDHLGHLRAAAQAAGGERPGLADARQAEEEVEDHAYKLEVLQMVRQQLPDTSEAFAATVADPWDRPTDDPAVELELGAEPRIVVGPAAVMTELVEGVVRNVAAALGEALGGPDDETDAVESRTTRPSGSRVPGLTPAIAKRLCTMAAAVEAYTDIWADLMLQQTYRFDPQHEPIRFDEFE